MGSTAIFLQGRGFKDHICIHGGEQNVHNRVQLTATRLGRGHSFSTCARKRRGSSKRIPHAYKGEEADTTKCVRIKVPYFMHFVIFSYAKYFYHTLLSLVTAFVTVFTKHLL